MKGHLLCKILHNCIPPTYIVYRTTKEHPGLSARLSRLVTTIIRSKTSFHNSTTEIAMSLFFEKGKVMSMKSHNQCYRSMQSKYVQNLSFGFFLHFACTIFMEKVMENNSSLHRSEDRSLSIEKTALMSATKSLCLDWFWH